MAKALCLTGTVIAVLLILIFGLDVAIGIPFSGVSKAMDIAMLFSACLLGYISWVTLREQG